MLSPLPRERRAAPRSRGLVFDVSTNDPITFAATTLLLAAVGLLACWLPARRASLADPVETMRRD
jgi:putative ABC transport system permease protein